MSVIEGRNDHQACIISDRAMNGCCDSGREQDKIKKAIVNEPFRCFGCLAIILFLSIQIFDTHLHKTTPAR